ncbi:hypothetical protein ACM16X_02335 [Haloarcula japonica]|uniref:hypothetical protein n=1 Tax=Haloarcula japonica TaxID=29282 RepID=UPI0039F681FE
MGLVDQGRVENQLWDLVGDLESVNPPRIVARCHDYIVSVDDVDVFLEQEGVEFASYAVLSAFFELSDIPWILVELPGQYFLVRTGFSQENWCPHRIAEELQEFYNSRYGRVNRDYRFEEWKNRSCTWFPVDLQARHVGDIRSLKFHGHVEVEDSGEWRLQDEEPVLSSEHLPE